MPIVAGTKLGVYEIVGPLGSGGMGEVYRARDPRIGRDVAIKVLPSVLANDPDRLQRFEQEAHASGILNHPNILSVYDIGRTDGSPYLVSEYLEGETLRDKLGSGPIPHRKAMDYALQFSRGLSAAHEKGIMHRDLKPENLFITKDGRLKILDFGLAKLTQGDVATGPLTQLPTTPGTEPGVLLGTVGYMSPEQVRGKIADHRSDIFAFGAILYEMLTGERAFRGETAVDTLSAILQKEPPEISDTNRNVSPALSRLVQHCLEKDPEQRFHSASDIAFDLESLSGFSEQTTVTAVPPERIKIPVYVWKLVSAFALVAALTLAFFYYQQISKPHRALHVSIDLPPNSSLGTGQGRGIALSRNGKYVAFPAVSEQKWHLWVRALEKPYAQMLKETEGADFPFWSPDSEHIAFFANGKLKKIKSSGGPVQTICDAPTGRGGSWNSDGTILLSPQPYGPLYRVSSTGGAPTAITKISDPKSTHRWPFFLPDGKHFLYTSQDPNGIFVASLDSQESRKLTSEASNAVYAEAGFLLFVREGNLVAQPFDPKKIRLHGEAFPVAEEKIRYDSDRAYGIFSISQQDVLSYQTGTPPVSQPTWFDRSGRQIGSVGEPGNYFAPIFSPDGNKISFTRLDSQTGKSDLWIYEFSSNRLSRLTYQLEPNGPGIWSPDQSRLAFSVGPRIFQKRLAAASSEELLFESSQYTIATSWSPDGRFLLFNYQNPRGDWDIWVLPTFGDRKPYVFLETRFADEQARFSPDGKWVAYMSNASGQNEVYVRAFSGSDQQWQISTDSGVFPQWGKDGRELFYFSKGKLMSVEIKQGIELFFSTPKPLFDLPQNSPAVIHPDGQRILLFPVTGDSGRDNIRLVLNWTQPFKK